MASQIIHTKGIVIGKTKLGESDLITRLLLEDGSRFEAVAKGARKPQSAISAKVELFNEISVVVSAGRGLGVIQDCKLLSAPLAGISDPTITAAASIMCEFALKCSQPDLKVNRFFELLQAGLLSLKEIYSDAADAGACSSTVDSAVCSTAAATLLKGVSILGMRPELSNCIMCFEPLNDNAQNMCFSFTEGGVACDSCSQFAIADTSIESYSAALLKWALWLIKSPFSEIITLNDRHLSYDLFEFAVKWTSFSLGIRLKSASLLRSLIVSCSE